MRILWRGAVLSAGLAVLIQAADTRPASLKINPSKSQPRLLSACPDKTLPDGRVCIPVPDHGALGGDPLRAERNSHRTRSGHLRSYDQIPRRPDRPEGYRRYRYPIPLSDKQSLILSGYDLHLPDARQRRGAHLAAVGHGGVDLAQKRGTEVRLVNLEYQVGNAEVLYVGPVFGNSIVTRHALREGGQLRDYVIIYGHLEGAALGIRKGMNVSEGTLLGFVGDSGSPGDVHLHLEIRRVRPKVDARQLRGGQITKNEHTVVCDPRNVLPLKDR